MLVNFVAARHLTEQVAPLMGTKGAVATISSAGGIGWEHMKEPIEDLLATKGFDEARRWLEARPDLVGEGYLFSKQVIIWWTLHAAIDLAPAHPGELHQPRAHRHADDALVRGLHGQGVHGRLPQTSGPQLDRPRSRPTSWPS